ncbi:DUF262 domain-containing protein [Corallococcus aberystwythensis]|uniref:DUF262 domain-containing protein n=2 Tax=Corallococcus aberystwythensis TaxID=2316722 RepID=A0A3A8QHA2_9BACT|nr:DUF262 domain-containing protein [Corallococcus aberystwythensis]
MWAKIPTESDRKMTDDEINAKYSKRELRIVTESNREQLPNFVEALKRQNWMELRPFYQRRPRWDPIRQSKLIESFIMNIPVPPLFVYESDLAKYEVMDGQQRITAIQDFYSNKLTLEGLEQWPELNGRIYDKLPSEIRKGIDRRSISYIVLLKESAETTEEEALLRQQVFERLNTGGVELENQEIRNCIYHGKFNKLLLDLTKNSKFREAWGLPAYSEEEDKNPPEELAKNRFFRQMQDAEVVLRFFALRHAENYRRGMAGFLDLYMVRSRRFTDEDVSVLESVFRGTIDLAYEIYGRQMFHPWDKTKKTLAERPYVAYADAVLVGISRHLEQADLLLQKKTEIVERTRNLITNSLSGTFTGQKNTKKDVQDRIRLFDEMLQGAMKGDAQSDTEVV